MRWTLPAVLALTSYAATLTPEWRVNIGTPGKPLDYRFAVCPGGLFFFTNGLGQVATILPTGFLLHAQDSLDGFERVNAMACAPDGSLYVNGTHGLSVYRRDSNGKLFLTSQARPEVTIARMTIGNDGLIYAVGRAGRNRLPLHLLSLDGKLLRSFGEAPSPFVLPLRAGDAFPAWDPAEQHLLVVPRFTCEIRIYDREGNLLRVVGDEESAGVRPVRDPMRRVDEVLGAARLSDGTFIVQIRGYAGLPGQSAVFAEIYDPDLKLTDTVPVPFGILVGSAQYGALYFINSGGNWFSVRRTRLK